MSSSPSPSTILTIGGMVAFALFVVFFELLLAHLGLTKVFDGHLPDGDNYLWLVRVRQYLEGGNWSSSMITGMNTPYGMDLHWTHPLDIIILALYTPLSFFMPTDSALFWAGATVPIALFYMFSASLYWAVRPLLPRGDAFLVLFISLLHPTLMAYSMLGRVDHNYLILTSMVLAVGGMIRLLQPELPTRGQNKAVCVVALATSFGLWVSTEFAPLLSLFMATPAMLWLWSAERKWINHAATLSAGLFICSLLALIVERGTFLLHAHDLDKLSILHIVALAFNASLWSLFLWFSTLPFFLTLSRSRLHRIALLAILGIIAGLLLIIFTPDLLKGPMGYIDPRVNAYLYEVTGELSSTWPTSFERASVAALWVGIPVLAIATWWGFVGRTEQKHMAIWIFLSLMITAYVFAGLMHARFAQLASPFASLFLVHTAYRLQQRSRHKSPLIPFSIILAPILICYSASSAFTSLSPEKTSINVQNNIADSSTSCDVEDVLQSLQALPAGRIMNDLNEGPGILYGTRHTVVAGAYHRNDQGIADALAFMNGPQDVATATLRKRNIDYVLFCLHKRQGDYARKLAELTKMQQLPVWFTAMPMPATLDNRWFLFKVNKEKLP